MDKRFFQTGTPQCGIAMGILGVIVAFMLLFLGFWRTLFVAALFGIGYFLGASSNKMESIKSAINRLFPPKND